MTDRNDLEDRLDAIADDVDADDEPPSEFGPTIVFGDGEDGYETEDGDPVPTDDDGNPEIEANGCGPTIIYSKECTLND